MKKDKKRAKEKVENENIKIEISSDAVHGEPHDSFDMINKFGTYNIQPTSDTHNDYPKIAQGLSKKENAESAKKDFGEK